MRNNVLFILVDQWPAWAFGFLGARFATPNTDRLAKDSTVFANAFTSCPLCTPARGALLTSRWACQTGVYDNYGVGYSVQQQLSPEEKTWIDGAVAEGYHVGYYGKWHLGPDGPIQRGAQGHKPPYNDLRPYQPGVSQHSYEGVREKYSAQRNTLREGLPPFWGESGVPKDETSTFRTAAAAVDFLEQYSAETDESTGADSGPFFLTASFSSPHFPHYLPKEYADYARSLQPRLPANIGDTFEGKPEFHKTPWWPSMDTSVLDEEDWKTVIAFSQAHITMTDDAIGRILDSLEGLGLAESTTVVFTADHGGTQGYHNRFDKGAYFYDEVWRIPFMIRSPENPPATQNAFVSILDVGKTLFDLAGISHKPNMPPEGRSLLPLVGSVEPPSGWPQVAYGVYDFYNGMSFAVRAIRDERYTYVWNPQSVDELYDHEADPAQLDNRATDPAYTEIVKLLRDDLFNWMKRVGDDLPERYQKLPAAGTITATGRMGP